jgi:hypothetical protein
MLAVAVAVGCSKDNPTKPKPVDPNAGMYGRYLAAIYLTDGGNSYADSFAIDVEPDTMLFWWKHTNRIPPYAPWPATLDTLADPHIGFTARVLFSAQSGYFVFHSSGNRSGDLLEGYAEGSGLWGTWIATRRQFEFPP